MLKNIFKRNRNIVVLKKAAKNTGGGTDATLDKSAPKTIESHNMILFDVTSSLRMLRTEDKNCDNEPLTYISAFAAPAKKGCFLFLEYLRGIRRSGNKTSAWALVSEDIFPSLVKLVNDSGLAKDNGFHSTTHGLPENFGGSVDIKYESGEVISFSNNQTPILSLETAEKIYDLFSNALQGEKIPLQDVSKLKEIHFSEERQKDGFTKAFLTINGDGTGNNRKQQKFEEPRIFDSEKTIDAETITAIKNTIVNKGVLAWEGLPENDFRFSRKKEMSFVFENGETVVIEDNRVLPDAVRGGFFDIELEITTKG